MFSIYRDQSAMSSLKDSWEQAEEGTRDAILRATRRLDRKLQVDPAAQGESRDGTTRVLFQAPLGVVYEIDETLRLVRILRAWMYRPAARD